MEHKRQTTAWFVAGAITTAVGAIVGTSSWTAKGDGDDNPELRSRLIAAKVLGWSTALAGTGMLTVGVVRGLDSGPQPVLRLGGRF